MATTTATKKCAHPACNCQVAANQKFCTQYCEDAGDDEIEIFCDCGHPACELAETAVS
jgi:hypothetical protein